MAIRLSDNLSIGVGAPIDNKYLNSSNLPYISVGEVTSTIGISQRYIGLTVNILNVEYWFRNGVSDGDLVIKSGSGAGASGERIEKTFNQVGHGFIIGDVVALSGSTFIKAIVDGSQNNIEIFGVVGSVLTVNTFTVVFSGYLDGLLGVGLLPNTTYYLSNNIAGELTVNDTTIFGTISKPILTTITNEDALVFQYRGFIVNSGSSGNAGSLSGITVVENIGVGTGEVFDEVFDGVSGRTATFRRLTGSGGTTVTTSGNSVVIYSDSSGLYDLQSPSNISVGGISSGTILTGKTANEILEELLITTYTPTLISPTSIFVDNQPLTLEAGLTGLSVTLTSTFDRGQILLQSVLQNPRSGLPNRYNYTGTGLPATVTSTSLTDGQVVSNYTVLAGANTWSSSVRYDAGVQPLDSDGNNFNIPLPSGTTSVKTQTITGIYPWFYGRVSSGNALPQANRPNANQALINTVTGSTGAKVVGSSSGTIVVPDFNSTSDDYIWFAIPATSTPKTIWYENGLSNGVIGIANSKFLAPVNVAISSPFPNIIWSGINYNIYISDLQSAATYMEFRNS